MTKNINNNAQKLFLKGSEAIAQTVAACQPGVVAAYPITPQTGILDYAVGRRYSGGHRTALVSLYLKPKITTASNG